MKNVMLILFFFPLVAYSQVNLSGHVKADNEAVAFATIVLSTIDSQFVQGTITDDNGAFEISADVGNYILDISHLNYETIKQEITLQENTILPTILMTNKSSELNAVVVQAKRPTIKREIDKTVVYIDNNPFLQSSNLLDALSAAPGVVIRNNQLAILGKDAVRVSMDGRMVELSGEDLIQFLNSLSASDIKSIEIITNPSARYEAEGNSGIINIITKRIKTDSWNNRISATHYQAKYGRQSFNNSFSFKKDKLSLISSVAYNRGDQHFLQIIEPHYTEAPQHIESDKKVNITSITPRILLDYNLNETTTIGFQYMGYFTKEKSLDDLFTTNYNSDKEVNNYMFANDALFKRHNYNSSYNLYFDKKLDTLGRQLTVNLDILDYKGNSENDIRSNLYDNELNFQETNFANLGKANYQIANYSGKIDMIHPLKWFDFFYGINSTFSKTNYGLDNFNTISGEAVLNESQSNTFDFSENIQSAYINASKKLNSKWELQAGLRYEHTQIKGFSKASDTGTPIFKNNYGRLFPTFYTRYQKDDNNVFSFNYGRRINRPAYSRLNPARTFISSQSSQEGNPFLRPAFSDNLEFTYNYKYNLSIHVAYSHISDGYSFIFGLNDETQEQKITHKNLYNENRFSISASYEFTFTPWWNARTMLFYSHSLSNAINPNDNVGLYNGGGLYGSINNSLTLNKAKTISSEINFWYDSPYNANLYSFGTAYALDIALNFKSIAKGLDLTVGVYDIFNSSPRTITSSNNGVQHDFMVYPSSRYARVSLSYNFGNNKISNRGRNFGNEDVRRRSN